MIVLLDNYDSFTHNLAHLLRLDGEPVEVLRCDSVDVAAVLDLAPRRIVISPGPGRPEDRGIAIPLVKAAAGRVPVLGICLGHQAIAAAFGARIVRAPGLVHGSASPVYHRGAGLLAGTPSPFPAMRYHSLVVDQATLPPELEVTAWLDDGEGTIMGLRHRSLPMEGLQFHPESFLTPEGCRMVRRFLHQGMVVT